MAKSQVWPEKNSLRKSAELRIKNQLSEKTVQSAFRREIPKSGIRTSGKNLQSTGKHRRLAAAY